MPSGIWFEGAPQWGPINGAAPPIDIDNVCKRGTALTSDHDITKTQLSSGKWVNTYNGTSSYLYDSTLWLPMFVDCSMLGWVRFDGTYADNASHVALMARAGGNNQFVVMKYGDAVPTNYWRVQYSGGGVDEIADYDDSTLAGKWMQTGFVKDGVNLKLALNGEFATTVGACADLTSAPDQICTGFWVGVGGNYWEGLIDPNFVLWDYAISAIELAKLYQSQVKEYR